jgi:hypothetical protein
MSGTWTMDDQRLIVIYAFKYEAFGKHRCSLGSTHKSSVDHIGFNLISIVHLFHLLINLLLDRNELFKVQIELVSFVIFDTI